MTKSRSIPAHRKPWTTIELEFLRANYPHVRSADLAAALERTLTSVYGMAKELGLSKSAEFLASPASGRTNVQQSVSGRFKPGIVPWNKGTNFAAGGRSVETRFKPGQSPKNTMPIGSYRIAPDGSLQRKTSNAKGSNSMRWRGVHELVWVAANGPVPAGHIVRFKPGMRTTDPDQVTLDKVECISLADNMRRNTRHNLPKELADLIALRGALTRQINKRSTP